GCSLGDVGGFDGVRAADLGGEQPDDTAAHEVGQRVHQAVDEVAVLVTPPQHDRVHDIAVVGVDHVGVEGVLDRDPEVVVGVGVPAELLDDHAFDQAESRGGTRGGVGMGGTATSGRAQRAPPSCFAGGTVDRLRLGGGSPAD